MKDDKEKKPKKKKEEIDLSKVSMDDIAKRFLETPPKPKTSKAKREKKQN